MLLLRSGDINELVQKSLQKTCFLFQNMRFPRYLDPESFRDKKEKQF